jgi:hypothetical protein
MEIVEPARLVTHADRSYVGIRVVTPFRGMLRTRDELLQELRTWVEQSHVEPVAHGFLRLYVMRSSSGSRSPTELSGPLA